MFSANGAGSFEPGATPQGVDASQIPSAESAIHCGGGPIGNSARSIWRLESRLQRLSDNSVKNLGRCLRLD
jgi:hypothetical protein